MRKPVFEVLVVVAVVACGGSGGGAADGGADAGGPHQHEGGGGRHDSATEHDGGGGKPDGSAGGDNEGGIAPEAGTDAPMFTGDGGLVSDCQAQAEHFATLCKGDDVRPCTWHAYAKLCETGPTKLLVDSMNCLDQSTCRTFSDANGGVACLEKTHAAEESTASTDYITSTCTACKQTSCSEAPGVAEIFPYLTDADIAKLPSCQKNACDLTTLVENCAASIPDVGLFLACVK